jgi:hypothetical protein
VVTESEPNDSSITATHFVPGEALVGAFNNINDFDYYGFDAVQGTTYVFWSSGRHDQQLIRRRTRCACSAPTACTRLAFSGDRNHSPANDGFIVWTCPETGTYYVRIVIVGTALGSYRIRTSVDPPGGQYERARDQRDAFVASSSDGATWSSPSLVHPSESPWFDNWLPEVAVAAPGSLYALWFDFADSPPGTSGSLSSTYMARSDDGGTTWSSLGPVSDRMADWTNSNSQLIPNQGDYLGLVASASTIVPVWADTRRFTPDVITAPFPLNQLQITSPAKASIRRRSCSTGPRAARPPRARTSIAPSPDSRTASSAPRRSMASATATTTRASPPARSTATHSASISARASRSSASARSSCPAR